MAARRGPRAAKPAWTSPVRTCRGPPSRSTTRRQLPSTAWDAGPPRGDGGPARGPRAGRGGDPAAPAGPRCACGAGLGLGSAQLGRFGSQGGGVAVTAVFGAVAGCYAAARPDYPPELYAALADLAGRSLAGAVVADVGAGTGIAARQMRDRGAHVVAIEPSAGMLAELVVTS